MAVHNRILAFINRLVTDSDTIITAPDITPLKFYLQDSLTSAKACDRSLPKGRKAEVCFAIDPKR
jgi:hypothetical protein